MRQDLKHWAQPSLDKVCDVTVSGCSLILHTPRSWVAPAGLEFSALGVLHFPSVLFSWALGSFWRSAQALGSSSIVARLVIDPFWGPLLRVLSFSWLRHVDCLIAVVQGDLTVPGSLVNLVPTLVDSVR